MYQTITPFTVRKGQATATVIAHSRHPNGDPDKNLITWELTYPRFIHPEVMTHKAFSRNASSSRATPVARQIAEVRENPVFFDFVGRNRPGMVATEALPPELLEKFRLEWCELGKVVSDKVEYWSNTYGIHKQTINRALEPWLRIRALVTTPALDAANFYDLRTAPDVQPEMRNLALAMQEGERIFPATETDWHIPYADDDAPLREKIIRSVAACARVSVLRGDLKPTTFEEDAEFVARLAKNRHMSPFEHVARTADPEGRFYNLRGWTSMRYLMELCGEKL